MAAKLIWSINASTTRKNILEYWAERNKSKIYSKKLNRLFTDSARQISEFPLSGKKIYGDFTVENL